MKTVMLVRNTAPEAYGGAEKYQLILAAKLKAHGMRPVIVSSSEKLLQEAKRLNFDYVKAPYDKKQNWSGVRNLLLPVYLIKLKKLENWYQKLFKEYTPSVVNIQSRDDWIAGTKAAKKMGIKVLWTDHMDLRSWVLVNIDKWYKNIIGKILLKQAKNVEKIIMISDFEKSQVEKMLGGRKLKNMIVIKNGAVDRLKDFKNIKSSNEKFIYAGRLIWYKGVFELIEAFKEVIKKYPKAELVIYGEGPDAKLCKEKAKGYKQIKFGGYVSEPLEKIAEGKYFVLASYREGLSLSLLDALMMGRVIIASDVDGNPELVKDEKTGFLVPAKNKDKLATAMIKALSSKDLTEKIAKEARKFYEDNFDFDKIFVEKMLPLYNEENKEYK